MVLTEKKWPFNTATIAPDDPGIFVLWDGDELICIGGTRHGAGIKAALSEHQGGRHGRCTERATHYSFEIQVRPSVRRRPSDCTC
jgi:hypothetical protein